MFSIFFCLRLESFISSLVNIAKHCILLSPKDLSKFLHILRRKFFFEPKRRRSKATDTRHFFTSFCNFFFWTIWTSMIKLLQAWTFEHFLNPLMCLHWKDPVGQIMALSYINLSLYHWKYFVFNIFFRHIYSRICGLRLENVLPKACICHNIVNKILHIFKCL